MPSRDQSFNDRATAFWGHHHLGAEPLTRIPGQGEFRLELGDRFVRRNALPDMHRPEVTVVWLRMTHATHNRQLAGVPLLSQTR